MRPTDIKKIKLEPDEALLVVFKGNLDEMDQNSYKQIKRHLAEIIPNASLARVAVICVDSDTEVDFTQIKMEKS
jgi:hypothetical protein